MAMWLRQLQRLAKSKFHLNDPAPLRAMLEDLLGADLPLRVLLLADLDLGLDLGPDLGLDLALGTDGGGSGRRPAAALGVDAAAVTETSQRTWAHFQWGPRWIRIDHAVVAGATPVSTRVVPIRGSDHRSLVVDLDL